MHKQCRREEFIHLAIKFDPARTAQTSTDLSRPSRTSIQQLQCNQSNIELVMNLQGDEPLMDVEDIKNLHKQMIKTKSKIKQRNNFHSNHNHNQYSELVNSQDDKAVCLNIS